MRFVDVNGVLRRARRYVSGSGSVQDEEVKNPQKLAEIIRQMQKRISEIESVTPPEPIEFEVTLGYGGAVTSLLHNLNGPVRWYVTEWTHASGLAHPVEPPILVRSTLTTNRILALKSYVPGRAVIRIEPAFADVNVGPVTATNPLQMHLAVQFDTTSTTIVPTNLSFAGCAAGETWDLKFCGLGSSSDANGMKYGVHGPAGSTLSAVHWSSTANMGTRNFEVLPTINVLGTTAIHTVAGGFRDDTIFARVKLGATAGAVGISVAKVTAGTASVGAGSSLIMTRCTGV